MLWPLDCSYLSLFWPQLHAPIHGLRGKKAVESARGAAKAHPVFGGSKMDWQNPYVIEEDDAFRVGFSPAPGWMGGSITYSVSKSDGQLKVVSAEQ